MNVIGIVATYLNPHDEQPVTVRVASHPFASDGHQWLPRVVAGSDPEFRLAVQAPWSSGRITASYGTIDVANPDGALDAWMGGIWTGQPAEVRVGDPAQDWDAWARVAIVRMEHPEYIDGRIIRLRFRSRIEDLAGPVQKHFFEGAPNEELDGQLKPMIVGAPRQLPALVYDEVSANEIYYYVADNYHRSPSNVWVFEGLGAINEGAGPGQVQDWPPYGFQLNSQPTLPVTVNAIGPRHQPLGVPSGRLLKWHEVDGHIIPAAWTEPEDFGNAQFIQRKGTSDFLEVSVSTRARGEPKLTTQAPVLKLGGAYRLHWHATASDNGAQLWLHRKADPESPPTLIESFAAVNLLTQQSVDFQVPFGFGDPEHLTIEFRGQSGTGLSAEFSALWLEDLSEPAMTLDQIVPYLLCERGVLDGEEEVGPFDYSDIDYDALAATTAATGHLHLGHYWRDGSSHRDLLDLLVRSCDAVWWIDHFGRFTCAPFTLTAEASVAVFDDTNRTTRIEVWPTEAEGLADSFVYMRRFRPVSEGESVETINAATKAAGARDYPSSKRAWPAVINQLHPDYRNAIGAEPEKTALVGPGGGALPDRANRRLQEHAQRIQYWRVEGILTQAEQAAIQPMRNITLHSNRLGISGGKQVQVLDLRVLLVSGRVQIIARG